MLASYVDESGSFDARNGSEPWVVLLAIGFDDNHWLTIERALNGLKKTYFPSHRPDEIEIRSNELRMAHVRPRHENQFSSLDRATLQSFGDDLYTIIDALPFAWSAAVMHKPTAARDLCLHSSQELYAAAYTMLLGRLDQWCSATGQQGRLFIDQREHDLQGRIHRAIVVTHDDVRRRSPASAISVIERPYFHDSSRSNHIQLADIMAYNVHRRYRNAEPMYRYFVRIYPKRYCAGGPSSCGVTLLAPVGPENDESGSDWVPPGSRAYDKRSR